MNSRLLNILVFCLVTAVNADDQPQWGQRFTRNMVSREKSLPESFDPKSGHNIKWVVPLGSETYATPIVAKGKVFIGTNNENPRDPKHRGDRGVMMCLNEKNGSLLWQLVIAKIEGDAYKDWYRAGICSPPTIEGDRVYVYSNRGEMLCLDINGMADGNNGPYKNEADLMIQSYDKQVSPGKTDADVIWRCDVHARTGTWPHDSAHGSVLIVGDLIYINTGNGVDNTHRKIRSPNAPSLIALDKNTGKYIGKDSELIGPRIFHCTWSSPSYGAVNGNPRIFFGGGNGLCYAFEAMKQPLINKELQVFKKVWSFDCDPNGPKTGPEKYRMDRSEGPSVIKGMPVFHKDRIYVAAGGDIWWGKNKAWLKCIDATGSGDITKSGEVWSYELNRHCSSTPSIVDGLVYIADCGRTLHCIDADTGKAYWTHNIEGQVWGSTMAADGKVYIGTRNGKFWTFAQGKKKKVLSSVKLDSGISGPATPANGVLYIATMNKLYAVAKD